MDKFGSVGNISTISKATNGENEALPTNERLKAVYGHFAETTTFGGLNHTYVSPHWIWRSVWWLVMLFLIGATAWNTVEVVLDYLSYPVVTNIQVAHQPSVPFPTVTICNRNPVQCMKLAVSYVKHPEELNNLMYYSNCAETIARDPLLSRLMAFNSNDTDFLAWRKDLESRMWSAIDKKLYAEVFKAGKFCADRIAMKLRRKKPPFEEIMVTLAETPSCLADLRMFLFPKLTNPAKLMTENGFAGNSSGSTEKPAAESSSSTPSSQTTSKPTNETTDLTDAEVAEKFVTEFASIFKDRSKTHLIRELADDFGEFIVNCSFFGKSCLNESQFVLDFAPDYGSCFTFNSQLGVDSENSEEEMDVHLTGSSYGLSVEVILNQDNYVPQVVAAGAGVRIAIITPGVRPNPVDEGYYVSPNMEADFGFRLQQFSRQPDPYESHCWDEWSQTLFQPLFFNLEKNETKEIGSYSHGECVLLCTSYLMSQKCACVEPRRQQPFLFKGEDITAGYGVCDSSNETQQQCQAEVLRKIRFGDPGYTCDCSLPCEETQYLVTTSSAEWPSINFRPIILKKYWDQLLRIGSADFNSSASSFAEEEQQRLITQEFAKINVYVQSLNIEEVSEDPLYDFPQTLGAVGGALGLYVGICVITLIEIGEFLILCLMALGGYNHRKTVEDDESGD